MMQYSALPYFGYIKKEDAKELIKRRSIVSWIFAGALALIFGILEFMVTPRLTAMYQDFGMELPAYANPTMRAVVFVVVIFAILALRPESESVLDEKLRRYKTGEMIMISKLVDYRYEMGLFFLLLAAMGFIIFSIILPVYNLTAAI